jgi:glycosyltransferase involved in cell wall biosynthesis
VPFDRRVWLECQSLTDAGYQVAVVCPRGKGDPAHEVVAGVEIYKYRPFFATGTAASFVFEYIYSFCATLWLTIKAVRKGRFDVIQSCNPPDIFWPIGWLFHQLHGSYFVFDHHDLCPELYESRFPAGSRQVHWMLCYLERRTMRTADRVISTNDSYRAIAIRRHALDPGKVTVVRTGPDANKLRRVDPDPALRRGRKHLVAYIGVMGPQDGVDLVLRTADVLVHRMHRDDIAFTLIGSGDSFQELLALRASLGLQDVVEFTGRIPDQAVASILSTADLGISPDPKNPLNDVSTMNKTMEYMAYELPVVAFDLRETRVSAEDAALYATPNDVGEMARLIADLLDDRVRRQEMGELGRARIVSELAWDKQAARYVSVYRALVGTGS